jgi:hypothetical protein
MDITLMQVNREIPADMYTEEEREVIARRGGQLAFVSFRVRDGIDAFPIRILVDTTNLDDIDIIREARRRLHEIAFKLPRILGVQRLER